MGGRKDGCGKWIRERNATRDFFEDDPTNDVDDDECDGRLTKIGFWRAGKLCTSKLVNAVTRSGPSFGR